MAKGELEITTKLQDLIKQQEKLSEKIQELEEARLKDSQRKNLKLIKDLMKDYSKQRSNLETEIFNIRKDYIKKLVDYENKLRSSNNTTQTGTTSTASGTPSKVSIDSSPDNPVHVKMNERDITRLIDRLSNAMSKTTGGSSGGSALRGAAGAAAGAALGSGGSSSASSSSSSGGGFFRKAGSAILGGLTKGSSKKDADGNDTSFLGKFEKQLNKFVNEQEAFRYSLIGSGRDAKDIVGQLNDALTGQGVVKQQEVYKNLTELTTRGILYNVEQRAYLQTIAEDLALGFEVRDKNLTRLINLQREDLTANRMAIQSSLKEFLNQNYETSQYIKEGFKTVSDNLLEAQALMTSNSAMELEINVQKWLGSLSSVGLSDTAVGNLASAIGQLGSGNISQLSDSSMQNLLVLSAARQGLSYGELLEQGVSGEAADKLIAGIVELLSDMGKSSSNVVKSEYARIFGVSVSDLVSASQVGNVSELEGITTDISSLLNRMNDFVFSGQLVGNMVENAMFGFISDFASDQDKYNTYYASKLVGGILDGLGIGNFKILGQGFNVGQFLPYATLLPSLLNTIGDVFSGFGSSAMDLLTPKGKALDRFGANSSANITFNKLAKNFLTDKTDEDGNPILRSQYIKSEGLTTGFTRITGLQTSGATIIAPSNISDIVKGAKTSAKDLVRNEFMEPDEEYYEGTDIYKLLDFSTPSKLSESFGILTEHIQTIDVNTKSIELGIIGAEGTNSILRSLGDMVSSSLSSINESILSLPKYVYETSTSLIQSANTVTIGNDLSNVQDIMMATSVNIRNIYHLLYGYFTNTTWTPEDVNNHVSTPGENWNWAQGPADMFPTRQPVTGGA